MFVRVPFLPFCCVSDGVLHETEHCFSCQQEIFCCITIVFCGAPCAYRQEVILFFSEGVLILAGVVIGDAEYTSIVIFIWVSNGDDTIA